MFVNLVKISNKYLICFTPKLVKFIEIRKFHNKNLVNSDINSYLIFN
jgi:hypothetical protein